MNTGMITLCCFLAGILKLKYRRYSAPVSNALDGPDIIRVMADKREPAPRHLDVLAGSQKWTALTTIVCCSQTKILERYIS
jgi:hypothetical protein